MATFQKAIEWMKESKKVRIVGWMSDRYLELDKPGNIWSQSEGNNRDLRHYFSVYEFETTTWELYEEQTCNKCTREYSGDSCSHCKEELTTTGEYNYGDITFSDHGEHNNIQFNTKDCDKILELKDNGDIFVKGKLIENDKEVVDGMRELLGFNKVKKENCGDFLKRIGTDGVLWAKEFMKLWEDKKDKIDEHLMIGWFCNAIEAGKDSVPRSPLISGGLSFATDDFMNVGYKKESLSDKLKNSIKKLKDKINYCLEHQGECKCGNDHSINLHFMEAIDEVFGPKLT